MDSMRLILIIGISAVVLYYGVMLAAIVAGLIFECKRARDPSRRTNMTSRTQTQYVSGTQSAARKMHLPDPNTFVHQHIADHQTFIQHAQEANTWHMDRVHYDADTAMYAHQQAHDICQQGNDLHNGMFNGGGMFF